MTSEESKRTKNVANLRIHVETVLKHTAFSSTHCQLLCFNMLITLFELCCPMQLKITFDSGRIIFMQEILQRNGYFYSHTSIKKTWLRQFELQYLLNHIYATKLILKKRLYIGI